MKYLYLVGFLSLFFGPSLASPVLEPAPTFGTITATAVNIRSKTSVRAEIVHVLPKGTEVRIHKFGNAWSFVSTIHNENYVRGWIWAEFLKSDHDSDWAGYIVHASVGNDGSVKTAREVNQARRDIVALSRDRYRKPCGCPDDKDRLGRSCRGKSAWEKENGASPLCFPKDVTLIELDAFFARTDRSK